MELNRAESQPEPELGVYAPFAPGHSLDIATDRTRRIVRCEGRIASEANLRWHQKTPGGRQALNADNVVHVPVKRAWNVGKAVIYEPHHLALQSARCSAAPKVVSVWPIIQTIIKPLLPCKQSIKSWLRAPGPAKLPAWQSLPSRLRGLHHAHSCMMGALARIVGLSLCRSCVLQLLTSPAGWLSSYVAAILLAVWLVCVGWLPLNPIAMSRRAWRSKRLNQPGLV